MEESPGGNLNTALGVVALILLGVAGTLGWLWWRSRAACAAAESRAHDLESRLTAVQADLAATLLSSFTEHTKTVEAAEEAGVAVEAATGDAVGFNFDAAFTTDKDT